MAKPPDNLSFDFAEEGLKSAIKAERRIEPGSNLRASWEELFKEARACTRCELYKYGTQTVFGEGSLDASILFVGEQPGDQEDLAGRPFVGPAARCSTPRSRTPGSTAPPLM